MELLLAPVAHFLVVSVTILSLWVERGVGQNQSDKWPCPITLAVNISDGKPVADGIFKENITYRQDDFFVSDNDTWGCVCHLKRCIRKCCAGHQVLVETKEGLSCVNSSKQLTNVTIYEERTPSPVALLEDYYVIHDYRCVSEESFPISPYHGCCVFLQTDGRLLFDEGIGKPEYYAPEDFCIDLVNNESSALVCYLEDSPPHDKLVYEEILPYAMIISMLLLFLTILVYAILPESSLHQRALMSYALTLLMGYSTVVTIQLSGYIPELLCQTIGYSRIFFFIVSFFWMNVMCVDMWLTFSGSRGFIRKRSTDKKFVIYCLYAWGVPMLHVAIVFLINTYGDKDTAYHPQLGETFCSVDKGLPSFLYFYLPMGIVIGVNVVLFILTAIKIKNVKKETSALKRTDSKRHSPDCDKQTFNLYFKLMLAMGVNWSLELISWAFTWKFEAAPSWIWYLSDFVNSIYGVVIFFIFVFKRNIWRSLKNRYYVLTGKRHFTHGTSRSAPVKSPTTESTGTFIYSLTSMDMKNGNESTSSSGI